MDTIVRLEDIGFYTLSDDRVQQISDKSPLWRCELIITDKCNFKCPYCRGLKFSGDLPIDRAVKTIELWGKHGLKNIRFTGGEPTLYPGLGRLVSTASRSGSEHIAISTNGSADFEVYYYLFTHGVNDFSISLDACCSSFMDLMVGRSGQFRKVVDNIERLSSFAYVTVGMVITETNIKELVKTVSFINGLGVSDIRIVPAAQYNVLLTESLKIEPKILNAHPILRYRINNIKANRNVRGINNPKYKRCFLVLDDMAVMGDEHYPCIIYLREKGKPIGKVGSQMREERLEWSRMHNVFKDDICRINCLDVCVDFNRKCLESADPTGRPNKVTEGG